MTDQYYSDLRALQRLHEGPLGPHIDAFAAHRREQGYARSTARYQIQLVAELSRWLNRRHLGIGDLKQKRVEEFLRNRKRCGRLRTGDAATFRLLLEQLHGVGGVQAPQAIDNDLDRIERAFADYLAQERGLSRATLSNYIPPVRQFLSECCGADPIRLAEVRANDVTRFVLRHAHDLSLTRAKLMVTALRAFLRFIRLRGEIATELAACVPTVAGWRLTTLPKSLEPEQVEEVLEHCNRQSIVGQRDFAILLLLARLGLRAGEVVALTLGDINWEASEITVRGKGARQTHLPLPHDVGKALVTYLKHGRPRCSTRRVFVRAKAPRTGFATSAAISTMVSRALARAGLHPPCKGAHLFRHSVASLMLRRGASLSEIGEILRHQHPDTTAIYAKVDLARLQALAQPWPGGGL